MAAFQFNLEQYLIRIGLESDWVNFAGKLPANLETLTRIQYAHMSTITFENLDVVMRKTIDMSSAAVERKLVQGRRGGYCFEQNTLLQSALEAIGYKVTPMLARVRWAKTPEMQTTFTHLVLVVHILPFAPEVDANQRDLTDVENCYLVDVGFGGIGSIAPLNMAIDTPQQTDALYRIARCIDNPQYKMLSWFVNDTWADMYAIRLEPAWLIDQEMSNFWSFAHPSARFTSSLFVARLIGRDRHHILNDAYNIRLQDGSLVSRKLTSFGEFLQVLDEVFLLKIVDEPTLEASAGRYLFPK